MRHGCFCKDHPEMAATNGFYVKFGRDVRRRFGNNYNQARQFLAGLRYKMVEGTFDARDYKIENPLSFTNQANRWLEIKWQSSVKPTTISNIKREMERAIEYFGELNVKKIREAEIEDFIFFDHKTVADESISSKTRHNLKSTLHQFFKWVSRREQIPIPDFPDLNFELGWRNIVGVEDQLRIIDKVKEISWKTNPKIWLGIKWLSRHINVRPGELRMVREGDILLDIGIVRITSPKEGSRKRGKYFNLEPEDIEIIKMFPKALPQTFFFRHPEGFSGVQAGRQFGPTYFNKWWKRACDALGIEGVGLYGGTKHSTTTALGELLTPEEIKRGGTGHTTNKAFERYLLPDKRETIKVQQAIDEIRGKVIQMRHKKR
jgi:integrase